MGNICCDLIEPWKKRFVPGDIVERWHLPTLPTAGRRRQAIKFFHYPRPISKTTRD
jgi:hypothetical protein